MDDEDIDPVEHTEYYEEHIQIHMSVVEEWSELYLGVIE